MRNFNSYIHFKYFNMVSVESMNITIISFNLLCWLCFSSFSSLQLPFRLIAVIVVCFLFSIHLCFVFFFFVIDPNMPLRLAPSNQVDLDSIYYVHPSEGTNSVNVTPKLDGSNYLAWHKSMKDALGAKNKLKFVDGSIQIPPADDLNFAQ